ncbi:MAG: sulfotransferase domain-containing protein [Pseudomonadales bacterium]
MIDRNRLQRAAIWGLTAPLPKRQRVSARRRWRAALDNRQTLAADVVVLSRAKSGRTWLRAILSRLYQTHYGLAGHELLEYDNLHRQNPAIPIVAMTHGHGLEDLLRHPRQGPKLRQHPVILLVRDPRDVAVSEFFQSTRRASDHKRELYGVGDAGSMFDFVMQSPLGLPAICDYLNRWHRQLDTWPRALRLRYEDLRAEPQASLERLNEFLQAEFSSAEIAEAIEFTSFEALKQKERENFYNNDRLKARDPDDPDSFKVRRGKVGGYRDYFAPEQLAVIDRVVADQLDPTLGYGPASSDT